MPTVRVSRIDRLEATIAIPETEAFTYSEGMKAEFTLLQDPSRVFTGTLSSVDRAVDSKTRTASARITLVNTNGLLKPGMVGRARILRKVYSSAVIVPSTALLRLQNSITAMVVENGIAHQRTIAIETFAGDKAVIKSGIQSGDNLIVSGAFQVTEGMRVTF
jgi:RND family efflux transporter MFP subunit